MSNNVPSVLAANGLIGGFGVVKVTHHRYWGGMFAAIFGLGVIAHCYRSAGSGPACALGVVYISALGDSHPLAKKIGPWPSVLTVSTVTAAAAKFLAH